MSVFVSYSHKDGAFANKLATNLMVRKVRVWVDTWELKAGDSMISKIQTALGSSSALLIVLSKNFLASEWCKKELNAGLMRELEERRVVVVPVLLEDCDRPLFLREKKYADFRTDFDSGLADVLEAIAAVTSDSQGRIERPDFHTDWSMDWGESATGLYLLKITMVEHGKDLPFSILTEVVVEANAAASKRQFEYEAAELGWWGRTIILEVIADLVGRERLDVLVSEIPVTREITIADKRLGYSFLLTATSRRLGQDTGKDLFVDIGGQLNVILASGVEGVRKPTAAELAKVVAFLPRSSVEELKKELEKKRTRPAKP